MTVKEQSALVSNLPQQQVKLIVASYESVLCVISMQNTDQSSCITVKLMCLVLVLIYL